MSIDQSVSIGTTVSAPAFFEKCATVAKSPVAKRLFLTLASADVTWGVLQKKHDAYMRLKNVNIADRNITIGWNNLRRTMGDPSWDPSLARANRILVDICGLSPIVFDDELTPQNTYPLYHMSFSDMSVEAKSPLVKELFTKLAQAGVTWESLSTNYARCLHSLEESTTNNPHVEFYWHAFREDLKNPDWNPDLHYINTILVNMCKLDPM